MGSVLIDEDSEDVYDDVYIHAQITSVCDSMSPADMLLSLTLECPCDCRVNTCPIKEINVWRQMDIKKAYSMINSLTLSEQKKLVKEHKKCSNNEFYKIYKK